MKKKEFVIFALYQVHEIILSLAVLVEQCILYTDRTSYLLEICQLNMKNT